MSRKCLFVASVLLMIAAAGPCGAYGTSDPEFRGLWVDAWHSGFKTAAQCDQLVADARASHCNALLVQMRRRGDVYYPSSYEPYASDATSGFDALAYLIQKAHSGSPRLEVHCYFATLAVATSVQTNPLHVMVKYPEYLSKDVNGETYDGYDYWLDPGNPNAEEYTYNVVMDVVNRYDVDGIHLDLIRFSGLNWGYNDESVARFNAINGRTGQPATSDTAWSQWRRDQVTGLMRKVYANAIATKPAIKVSVAAIGGDPPATSDENWTSAQAYRVRFQDWRSWIEEGIVDLNITMDYYDCDSTHFEDWVCFILSHQYDRASAVGYSATSKECACIQEQVGIIRNPSCSVPRSHGFAQFSYASGGTSCIGEICPSDVAVPAMPWKTSPTKGHIKGTVNYGGVWMDHALVTLTGPVSRSMYADGTGFYAFIDVPAGTYTVSATRTGYGTDTKSVAVTVGQVTTQDVDLNKGGITFSSVQSTGETSSTATITWTTNILCTSQVYYGTDRNCSIQTTENTSLVQNHSVTISGLQPQTAYYFRVVSRTGTIPFAQSQVYALVTAPATDFIMDDPEATYSGVWSTTTASGSYGTGYHWVSTATSPARTATYAPTLPAAGDYKVYLYYKASTNRSTQTPVTINYNGGSTTIAVNQSINGGAWFLLQESSGQMRQAFPFAAGSTGSVVISNAATGGYVVVADAVRFQLQTESTAPTAPSGLQAQAVSHEQIRLTWTASTDNAGVAGYRIYRDGSVVGISTTNSYTDPGLTPNKRYAYYVSAFDTSGNKSGNSSTVYRYTLSLPPTSANITCDQQPGVWHTANPFTFHSIGDFGAGTVSFYSYAWDTLPTHTWAGTEYSWVTTMLPVDAVSGSAPYYLHLTGYNDDYIANGSLDLGPYYLDTSAPPAPAVTPDGSWTASPTQIHASWSADDPESGVDGYQYAVGASAGGDDIAGWTTTSGSQATITFPEQQAGTQLYVSVKAKNGAGVTGSWGASSAITIGAPVDSAATAKGYADGLAVRMSNCTVTAVYADCFYVTADARSAGVRVDMAVTYPVGSIVNVGGRLATADGERRLVNAVSSYAL